MYPHTQYKSRPGFQYRSPRHQFRVTGATDSTWDKVRCFLTGALATIAAAYAVQCSRPQDRDA